MTLKKTEFLPNLSFNVLLFVMMTFLLYFIGVHSPYTFSQLTTSPNSIVVQNYSVTIPPSSTGGVQESYEAKTNNMVVLPISSKIIQLSNVAIYTETKGNTTSSEIPIHGETGDNDSIPTTTVVIPKQTLLNGT